MIKYFLAIFAFSILAACCPTGTTVVLIPDANGKVGQVALTNQGGSTVLMQANHSAQAENADSAPSQPVQLSDEDIKATFGKTLASEPLPPKHFTFYFETGKADLLSEATEELAKAKTAVDERKSCDLSVIGHADRIGNNETNRGISTQRAKTVAEALIGLGVSAQCLDTRYYGENDPAVPTADEVAEPRNRRVEVEIR